MPKIIENLESRLIAETRHQIETIGYAATTIRSVAAACGVGVGTVYNYFPSKDDMAATYLLKDWENCIQAIQQVSDESADPHLVVRCIYDQLRQFAQRHRPVFQDPDAAASFVGSFTRYHSLLRSQLSTPLERFFPTPFGAEFVAEALLTWTMAGKTLEEIFGMIGRLF